MTVHVAFTVHTEPGRPTIKAVARWVASEKRRLRRGLCPQARELFTRRTVGRRVCLGVGYGRWAIGSGEDACSWARRNAEVAVEGLLYSDTNSRELARTLVHAWQQADRYYQESDEGDVQQ